MDIEALRHGNFASLGTAVDDWTGMIKHLTAMERAARDDLMAKANRANWAGVNATVSREFINRTAGEFTDAVIQATSVRNILRDTRGELISYRDELNRAIDRGWDKHLSVVGVKGGGFSVHVNVHPEPAGSKEAMVPLRDELQGILDKATESDSTAAEVLKALANHAEYGFSDASYKDRDSAADAVQAAKDMAKIVKKDPGNRTAEDLANLNEHLRKYGKDPLFSEQFALSAGSKETLQFWAEVTDRHSGVKGTELEGLRDLQKNLSLTLASATYSDSALMKEWKHDLINEGNTAFRADPANPLKGPVGAIGFQVISSLMGHGKYDSEFLDEYGQKLLKSDMAPAGSVGMNTKDVWTVPDQSADLVFGDGNGHDPVTGFMSALSHNAEAATNIFDDKAVLDHVLQSTKYTDRGETVGHALEAAVTSVSFGEVPTEAAPHSKTQVEIMKNVMNAVAQPGEQDDGLVQKGIGASFGHMASAYMPEISQALAGRGAESIFLTNSAHPDGLDRTDVGRFLANVAEDNDGRAAIRFGESIYTNSLLEAHISDPSLFDGETSDAIATIAQNVGVVEGIASRSVADMEISESLDAQKSDNEAIKTQGDFYKAMASMGVGVGAIALAPETLTGSMVGAAGGGFFGGVIGMAVDRLMDGREADGALDEVLYSSGKDLNDAQDSALKQTQTSAHDVISRHESKIPEQSTNNLIRDSLNEGWSRSDGMLEDTRARPSA